MKWKEKYSTKGSHFSSFFYSFVYPGADHIVYDELHSDGVAVQVPRHDGVLLPPGLVPLLVQLEEVADSSGGGGGLPPVNSIFSERFIEPEGDLRGPDGGDSPDGVDSRLRYFYFI